MEINYREYSLRDLEDVLRNLDREKYPQRLLQIEAEIARKKASPEYEDSLARKQTFKKYNTFWPRLFAHVIDGLVLVPIDLLNDWIEKTATDSSLIYSLWYSANTIAIYLYFILMHGYFGQTLGKMLFKVKVFDVSEQNQVSIKQAFFRDCIPLIMCILYMMFFNPLSFNIDQIDIFSDVPIVFWFFAFFGLFWRILEIGTMLNDEKRRAFHDYIAGTVVIRI